MLMMHINIKLVQVLQYLCQLNLNIYYKLHKDNIVLNLLLQLVNINTEKLLLTYDELDTLLITKINFTATIIQINNKL